MWGLSSGPPTSSTICFVDLAGTPKPDSFCPAVSGGVLSSGTLGPQYTKLKYRQGRCYFWSLLPRLQGMASEISVLDMQG